MYEYKVETYKIKDACGRYERPCRAGMESDCRFAEYGAGFWDSGHLRKEDLKLKLTVYCAMKRAKNVKFPLFFYWRLPDRSRLYRGRDKNNKTIIHEREEEPVFR